MKSALDQFTPTLLFDLEYVKNGVNGFWIVRFSVKRRMHRRTVVHPHDDSTSISSIRVYGDEKQLCIRLLFRDIGQEQLKTNVIPLG